MNDLTVRECRESDLAALELYLPSGGNSRYHDARFDRQRAGASTFLVAYLGTVPVGTGEIRWQGCAEPVVQERYPDCPEINGLGVYPPQQRSRGVGTAIIHTAERLAARRGYREIGLGVDERNTRAAALYRRLGYYETGCHYFDRYHYMDDNDVRHDVADPCRFLIKPITATTAAARDQPT